MKEKALARGAALAGVISVITLVAHSMILGSLPPASSSVDAVVGYLAGHYDAVSASAWLDGIGTILLVVVVYALVRLAAPDGFAARLATRLATVVIALSLVIDAVLIAAAHAARAGHGAPASAMYTLASGMDYAFPLANCVWMPALGLLLLRSAVLPRGFGHAVILVGAAELAVDTVALFSPAVAAANNFVFIAFLAWLLVASVTLGVRSRVPVGEAQPELVTA